MTSMKSEKVHMTHSENRCLNPVWNQRKLWVNTQWLNVLHLLNLMLHKKVCNEWLSFYLHYVVTHVTFCRYYFDI